MKNREFTIPDKAKGFTYIQSTRPSNPRDGDTWYDTATGRVYVYHGGWIFPKNPDSCWEKNPPVVVIEGPSPKTISTENGYVDFTVRIKNMDVGVCGKTTFTVNAIDDNTTDFMPSEVIPNTIDIGPHQEGTVTLRVRDRSGAATESGVNNVYVLVSADEHDDSRSNTVSVRLTGDAFVGCAKNAPTVTISPSSQEITTDGDSVTYTVSVKNNDTGGACSSVTFSLEVVDDNTTDFEPSTLSTTSVTVAPGNTETVTLTVRDKVGAATGDGINHTFVRVSAPDHPTVESSPVTTVLSGYAETGWIKNAPTVTITPSSGDISEDGGTFTYTVTIKNNDTGASAQATTFTVNVSDSNTTDFEPSVVSPTSVTLNPGQQTMVTLTVKDKLGAASS